MKINVMKLLMQRRIISNRTLFKVVSLYTGRNVQTIRSYHQKQYDVAIIGGGIVGLATAQELIRRNPGLKYILLEKENTLAEHQTGHNSGVIHAGIYYTPGSLKARLCVEGLELMYKYCDEYNIPYKKTGKLIVALTNDEVLQLQKIYDRGKENKVPGLMLMVGDDIKQVEPHCQGVAALHSPNTGTVDYGLVAKMYGKYFEGRGGTIVNNYEVTDLRYVGSRTDEKDSTYPVQIHAKNKPPISCCYVITSGGLYSDRLAAISGCKNEPKIVPFRGDYLMLKPDKSHLVNGHIYPVPDLQFPFLGVHFSPQMDGSVWMGPNAILAFKREGYRWFDFSYKDAADALSYRGLRKLLQKNWKFALAELYHGIDTKHTVRQLQRFIPEITKDDIERGPSGVRAQALDRDGNLVDDFVFDFGSSDLGARCFHVRNAPSPAATSSLAIAKVVVDRFQEMRLP